MKENLPTLCVCGAGTMGSGIAQVAATAGCPTILYDVAEERLQQAKARIENDLGKLVAKQKMTEEEKEAALQRLVYTTDMEQCVAQVVIEAIVEELEAKVSLLARLAQINGVQTLLASNTSSLSLLQIARQVPNSQRVVGLHFFNPAPLMKLVEVVYTEFTTTGILEQATDLVRLLQKTPVVCKDAPGFIVNRVARPYYLEALRLAEEGVGDYETIDRLLEGAGFKMGPFRLMDLIGNDINYTVSCSVYEQLRRPGRLRPSALQQQKVEKGELGRKSGRGYYHYE
ncbi:3-hydroxyacyl-CoA dehydrogenase NAD-binding domain-containing protein [Paraflavisolibacter sp. H34]|uniref:3-hydroxyacyl-CoA dehydrogenase family protein n=1 Tax=Huijunlia imazamoxiresistens TaxID=3127457 RepID=UPI00301B1F15